MAYLLGDVKQYLSLGLFRDFFLEGTPVKKSIKRPDQN